MLKHPAQRHHLDYIDGLRALAVLAVIINHFFESLLPAGYLGVDIFFVISGFVITMTLRKSGNGGLTPFLLGFYARRVKRLLPALLACIVVTSALFVLLTTLPPVSLFLTASYAVFGMSNIYLYLLSFEYFSLDAQLNPFTHTWSLGVEEQYYFIYPGLFYALGLNRTWSPAAISGWKVLAALTVASFCLDLAIFSSYPSAAFYLLPTRFWELGLGGLTYWAYERGWKPRQPLTLGIAPAVLISAVFSPWTYLPILALTCALATSGLILALEAPSLLGRIFAAPGVTYAGRISYSLYLSHWSLLVLAQWTIGASLPVKLAALGLLPLFAAASYHYVEQPLRFAKWFSTPQKTILAALTAGVLGVALINGVLAKFSQGNNQLLARLTGVSATFEEAPSDLCDFSNNFQGSTEQFEACLGGERTPEKPHFVYMLGDSHADCLRPAIERALAGTPYALKHVKSRAPVEYPYSFFSVKRQPAPTADYILQHAQPGDYVVTIFHRGLLNEHRDNHVPLSKTAVLGPKAFAYIENMSQWTNALSAKKVRVIFVRDTPLMRVIAPVTACAMQIALTGSSVCRVGREQDLHTRKRQDDAIDAVASNTQGALIWDPAPKFFGDGGFADVLDQEGRYLLFDWNHITAHGAKKLAPAFKDFFESLAPLEARPQG